ncbi:biotin transporter BioY [Alloscardovia macacae]|uniref:biotin transporter BioY n=1 Tax=Alloscardovia macacae TaxID=1160091 RepID=UPI0015D78580|nr:biotin transporter BioY [Alloscardovia macacae]
MFITSNIFARFHSISWGKYALFTLLLTAAGMAGKVTIPGTQVGITMQTFVLMLVALNLTRTEGLSVLTTYIALGSAGLPVFSGGMSTAALVGPSAGFIWGFIPALLISEKLARSTRENTQSLTVRFLGYSAALTAGMMVFLYLFGVSVQSAITGLSWTALMSASLAFIPLDIVKALVAVALTLGITGLARTVRTLKKKQE